jgi:hypothetical protein
MKCFYFGIEEIDDFGARIRRVERVNRMQCEQLQDLKGKGDLESEPLSSAGGIV